MLRKRLLAVVACAVVALAALAPSASAQSAGGCELQGTASFTPGLNSEAKAFAYSFNGNLSSCQSSEAGAPANGTVSAGEIVTINGQQFQEPIPAGNGSCESSTTAGTAIVTWSDGTTTVVEYSTTGAAAAIQLQGSVVAEVTLQAVNPGPGQPTSINVATTRYANSASVGLLAFQPPDPTACNTPAGVSSAGISGFIGLGNAQ
jgi:IPT/TIG domain-containing protein